MTPQLPSPRSVFGRAVEIESAAERKAYLDDACADAPQVRERVEALLRAHEAAGGFLQPAGTDPDRTSNYTPPPDPPSTIGPYKLLEKIGEGGMGEVWVADQLEPIQRRVALKLIKPGMDSRGVLARFEAERQALALMDHPNIARVLDAGTTPDGRPYFVMELVKGTPITEFCDVRKLSPKERLELFVPVCQAIQHAHQKGIIHRDIKPSNVLVELYDDRAVPKVIDFGVAKAVGQRLTEKTLYTGFGALVGTPAYMAPEQATFNALDVDTRADVYALGVILYELLAGSPPIEKERLSKAALDEVLRIIRDEEPPRPSHRLSTSQTKATIASTRGSEPDKLSALMKGELDWIVMKALEKDRTRRYETATGLAKDVQRHLAGETVEACPPTLGYRLRKVYRRNRGSVVTAAAFALVLLVATGVSLAFGVMADRAAAEEVLARVDADQKAAEARDALEREAEQRVRAEETISQLLTLLDSFTTPGPDSRFTQPDIQKEPKEIIETAVRYYKELLDRQETDHSTRSRIAAALLRVADLGNRVGEDRQAIDALNIAIREYTALSGKFPEELEHQRQLAECHINLCALYGWKGHKPDEAIRQGEIAQDIYRALLQRAPNKPEYRMGLSHCQRRLGHTYERFGTIQDADRTLAESAHLMRNLATEYPDNLEYQYGFSDRLLCQVNVFATSGRRHRAIKLFEEAKSILLELVEKPDVNASDRLKYQVAYLITLSNQGGGYQLAGKLNLAEKSFLDALNYGEKLSRVNPNYHYLQRAFATVYGDLGVTLAAKGDLDQAMSELEKAMQSHLKNHTAHGGRIITTRLLAFTAGWKGRILRDQGHLKQSADELTRAIGYAESLRVQEYNQYHGQMTLPYLLGERAISFERLGKWEEALRDWDKAIEHCREFRKQDEAAFKLGRLATELQRGTISLKDAIAKAESERLLQDTVRSLDRKSLAVRFYAVLAKHFPDRSADQTKYAELAVGLLKTIVEDEGPCFVGLHTGNTDFDVLHNLDSYKQLLQSVDERMQDESPSLK